MWPLQLDQSEVVTCYRPYALEVIGSGIGRPRVEGLAHWPFLRGTCRNLCVSIIHHCFAFIIALSFGWDVKAIGAVRCVMRVKEPSSNLEGAT